MIFGGKKSCSDEKDLLVPQFEDYEPRGLMVSCIVING